MTWHAAAALAWRSALDPRLRSSIEFLTQPTEVVRLDELRDLATGNPLVDLRTALKEIQAVRRGRHRR